MTSDAVTTERTPDGRLAIVFMPSLRVIKIDLSHFSAPVVARWYDASHGTFSPIEGSPFANSGRREFVPPGRNSDGDGDWVLVLEANPRADR